MRRWKISNLSKQVDRFLTQVTTDHISLTGMKFFSITRSLILTVSTFVSTPGLFILPSELNSLIELCTCCPLSFKFCFIIRQVAGTIVTYELVLVQFNAVQQQPSNNNITKVCEVKWEKNILRSMWHHWKLFYCFDFVFLVYHRARFETVLHINADLSRRNRILQFSNE